jgi:hypothetical protein
VNDVQAIQFLSDFSLDQGEFSALQDYVGMEASKKISAFLNRYGSLDEESRFRVASVCAAGFLGTVPQLADFRGILGHLMQLVAHQHPNYLLPEIASLEREYTAPSHIAEWMTAPDSTGGGNSAQEWSYAFTLAWTLHQLGSKRAGQVTESLIKGAQSASFRKSLSTLAIPK